MLKISLEKTMLFLWCWVETLVQRVRFGRVVVVVAPFRLNELAKALNCFVGNIVLQNGLQIPMLEHWQKHTQNQSQPVVYARWLAAAKATFLMALVEGRFRIVSGFCKQRIQTILNFRLTSL